MVVVKEKNAKEMSFEKDPVAAVARHSDAGSLLW
jgi:hypothetical protein